MRFFRIFLVAAALMVAVPAVSSAQTRLYPAYELIELESNDVSYSVFALDRDGQKHYYMDTGPVGMGGKVIKVNIDPISQLYVDLGETLEEALETLAALQACFDGEKNQVYDFKGSFTVLQPKETSETIHVQYRKPLLTRYLELYADRDGVYMATQISRTDLNALVRGVKSYKKLHPKEK